MRNVRVFYKKLGRMKYVSHLDMNRYMARLIKLSGIPAWHTEGFNQHLYITFALPLSLGVMTDYDCFDLKIVDDTYSNQMIVDSLSQNAVPGIEIIRANEPWMKTAELKFAEFTLTYKDENEELLDALEKMLLCNVIMAEKKGKKNKVTLLNLAEKLKDIKTERAEGVLKARVVLPAGNDENINPSLLLTAFLDAGNKRPSVCLVNRNMLYDENMNNFE